MDVAVRQVHIDADRSARLAELAAGKGVTEDALIADALDLLFHETALHKELRADWEVLRQMEAEREPVSARPITRIDRDDIVSIAATPIAPQQIRRLGEAS